MCGILLHYKSLAKSCEKSFDSVFEHLKPIVHDRGSDFEQTKSEIVQKTNEYKWYSSVLSLRQPLCKQPIESHDNRFVVQFNGELYNKEILDDMNDVDYLNNTLQLNNYDLIKTLRDLRGEFAYVITDKLNNEVWFGKDSVGKRSLSYCSNGNDELLISSCTPSDPFLRTAFIECESNFIYFYSVNCSEVKQIDILKERKVVTNLTSNELKFDVELLHNKLSACVRERIETIHPLHDKSHGKSLFGILFSGGIDCTLIAALCAEVLIKRGDQTKYKIDLLNVGFTNPRANLKPSETPDRKLALKSTAELNNNYKNLNVEFKLIEIDVSYEEYLVAKKEVLNLIYPNDTEMDLSIAIAFYFASGGKGISGNSDCKVLLSGLGADELFGGYTRHEMVFTEFSNYIRRKLKNKPQETKEFDMDKLNLALKNELQLDIERIWIRNLSRDDRVISHWSKEARYPFLDQLFIDWVETSIPIDYKLNFNKETGQLTRKKALRELALYMKLDWVSQEPKRAIQFGSKSAKMDLGSGKRLGHEKAN